MHIEATDSPKIASEQLCVIYNSKTGAITHVHQVITMAGGQIPTKAEVKSRAMALATQGKRSATSQSRVLFAEPEAFAEPGPKKVDVKRLQVVPAKIIKRLAKK